MFECIITIILAHCFLRLCSGDKVRHSLSMCSPPMFFFFNKFIYLFLAALGLHCCSWAFSGCGERGLLFIAVRGLLIVVASVCCGARALGAWASVVVARRLHSCGSRAP